MGLANRFAQGLVDPETGEGFHGLIGFDFDGDAVDFSTYIVGPDDEIPSSPSSTGLRAMVSPMSASTSASASASGRGLHPRWRGRLEVVSNPAAPLHPAASGHAEGLAQVYAEGRILEPCRPGRGRRP